MAETEKPRKGAKPAGNATKGAKAKGGKPDQGKDQAPDKSKGKARAGAKAPAAASDAQTQAAARPKDNRPRMKVLYEKVVCAEMAKRFGYGNKMQVPRLEKIVLNMGIGEAVQDRKKVESAANDLALIAGQKPVTTHSRKSIATYKLRTGMPIGAKVTLRGDRMYEFLDRLITIALPRVKDFRGLSPRSFDGRGNFALGLKEHIVFPEIDYDKVDEIWGLDVVVCTTARSDDEARELLRGFNFPFRA